MLRRTAVAALAASLFPAAALAVPVAGDPVVFDPIDGYVPDYGDVLPPEAMPEPPPTAEIVNGTLVRTEEFPEVVYLAISTADGGSSCTGSLIQSTWVLTASHCVDDPELSSVEVIFGNNQANPEITRSAIRWITHPDWAGSDNDPNDGPQVSFAGDVALLELDEPVTDRAFMALNDAPIDNSWLGLDNRSIGFGITRWQGSGGGIKRKVDVPISGFNDFEVYTYGGTHSTCQGDSGGPSVIYTGLGYSQVGVTSYGIQCGTGRSADMRVDFYLDWIKSYVPNVSTRPSAPPTFLCSHQFDAENPESVVAGVVGEFDLKCATVFGRPEDMQRVQWEWGDGTVTEGYDGDHTYEEPGNYTLRTCFDYSVITEEGGDQEVRHCIQRDGYVRACGVPDVAFTLADTFEPKTLEFRNQTDLSTYGCVFSSQWDIFEGDSASGTPIESLEAWAPTYTFDKPGTYTVVLNVGGLAGTGAAKATVRVTNTSGEGCSQVGGRSALGGLGLLSLLALGLRRRR